MYGGGRALVCVIVGGGHLPWVVLLLVLWGGTGWRIKSECVTCVALGIRCIEIFLLFLVLLWCQTLRVKLARSCIVPVSLYSRCAVC